METIDKAIKDLTAHLEPHQVISDIEILDSYGRDETSDLFAMPHALVRAESTADVSTVLTICSKHKVPVIPRGAGSGVTGGAVPVMGGVVLSMEKMNRILEIDTDNMTATVEPGAITGEIQNAVKAHGLMYPPDPASLDICSIGGNVAEIAGGPSAVKYGTTKDYVLGLECVLPDGGVISTGGKYVKNATGYNLTGIILGSEGTLAVITKIFLRLIPAPLYSADVLIPFDSMDAAMKAVTGILSNRIIPATMEFMEEDAIKLVSRFHSSNIPFPDARAHLLVQLDGGSPEAVDEQMHRVASVLDRDDDTIIVAQSGPQRERIWKARRGIREAIHAESPVFLAEDCVVPRSLIPRFLVSLKEYFTARGLTSVIFGHAGDGNVHIDILKGSMQKKDWDLLVPVLKREIYSRAITLGGTITGEHGIGCIRKDYLAMALSPDAIELMKRIKRAFDPGDILNPGKIFP